MKAQIICYNTTISPNQLDELKTLMPIITAIDIEQYQGEIKLFDNPYTKTKSVDFNWLRTIFDPYYDIKCFVFAKDGLKDLGITNHWGLYSLDVNTKHEYYITNLGEDKLDKRAKANGFKTNFAWMFCHEYMHGSVWGNTRNASQAANLPHEWEKEGVLKEKLAEDVKHYQLLNQTKSLLERFLELLKKKSSVAVHPIPKEYRKYISQHFLTPNNLYISGVHNGTDWAVPKDTPIYAPQDGTITAVYKDHATLGNACEFVFGDKAMRVLHLSKVPKLGKYKAGAVLGYSGNSGLSTGHHVHLDVWKHGKIEIEKILTKQGVKDNLLDPEVYFNNFV